MSCVAVYLRKVIVYISERLKAANSLAKQRCYLLNTTKTNVFNLKKNKMAMIGLYNKNLIVVILIFVSEVKFSKK